MAQAGTSVIPLTELGFELDRFAWSADGRLEVAGRWYGVTGRRFVRPVLNVRGTGRRRRLIAVLDHKPWAPEPETDELWIAAFPWQGSREHVTGAGLVVSPDLMLDLPPPGEDVAGTVLHPKPRRGKAAARAPEPAPEPEPEPESAAAPSFVAALDPPAPAAPAPSEEPVAEDSPVGEDQSAALVAAWQRAGEERAERQRLAEELAQAQQRLHALDADRAREVGRLEHELALALARAEVLTAERAAADEGAVLVRRELAAVRERAERLEDEVAELSEVPLPRTSRETILTARGIPPRRQRRAWGWSTWIACAILLGLLGLIVDLTVRALT
jgi:hypothetical protein